MENNSQFSILNSQLQNRKVILLVEDNEQVMDGNKRMLERAGYDTAAALTLAEAGVQIAKRKPDLIVLDIMLPDGSGLDFMADIRESENAGVPILLLTGLGTKADMLRGLKDGGDDYMKKPYDFEELLMRIETLLRRAARVPENITFGHLHFDVTADMVTLDGSDLLMTQKEFSLLLFLAQHAERFLSTEYLLEKVWKAPGTESSQSVRKTVSRIRDKIKGSGWTIAWSKGEGYSFTRE